MPGSDSGLWAAASQGQGSVGPTLRVLDDVLQQQRVLGEPLHLGDDEVSKLQSPALRVALGLLRGRTHKGRRQPGSGAGLWAPDPRDRTNAK